MELSGYLAIVRRWWWTLAIAVWVAALGGYIVASEIPPTYESQVQLLVGPINTDSDTLRASGQLVQTYAQIVTTEPRLESVIAETGLQMEPAELAESVRATANDVTRVLTIRVLAGDPEDAATLANALATEMIQLTGQGITRPEGELQVIEFARAATDPVAPQVSLLMLLAAAAGLVGALVLILLVEYFGDAVRSGEDLAREAGAPMLGTVGVRKDVDLAAQVQDWRATPDSDGSRRFQLVAARLAVAVAGAGETGAPGPRSILVLDASRDAARSGVAAAAAAAGLAGALTRLGAHPVLVDGSAAAGPLTEVAGLTDAPGVTEVLDGSAKLAAATGTLADLPLVPGGRGGTDRLAVDGCLEIVAGLTGDADARAIVAAPSLRSSSAALIWARACDAAVIVADADGTRRSDVRHAVGALPPEMPVLGAILVERRAVGGGFWQRLRPARPGPAAAGPTPGTGGSAS